MFDCRSGRYATLVLAVLDVEVQIRNDGFIRYRWQSMSTKRSIVLLGAGASVEAGVPGSVGMIDRLTERLKSPEVDLVSAALNYVRTSLERQRAKRMVLGLQGYRGVVPRRSQPDVDIEQIMRAVDLLIGRDESDLSPFVLDWDEVATSVHQSVFRDCRQRLEQALVQELWMRDDKKVEYLQPLAGLLRSGSNINVVTLNYDNCLELACQSLGIELDDCLGLISGYGLAESSIEGSLLKLHGSVDWSLHEEHVGDQDAPTSPVATKMDSGDILSSQYIRRAMIFGSAAKLSAEKPFFDLFLLFYQELMKSDELYVVGYSFRDLHINALIRRWLAARHGGVLRIADPEFGKNAVDDLPFQIKSLRGRAVEFEQSAGEAIAKWFT